MLQNNIHNKHVNYTELEEGKGHWECWVQYGAAALFNGEMRGASSKKRPEGGGGRSYGEIWWERIPGGEDRLLEVEA